MPHWAIFTENSTPVGSLLENLLDGPLPDGFEELEGKKGALFSSSEILRWMEEELKHDKKVLTKGSEQGLQSMSSGERKKALFSYLLSEQPDYLILHNAFDNLDNSSREELMEKILGLSNSTSLIQILSRRGDLLPFTEKFAFWQDEELRWINDFPGGIEEDIQKKEPFIKALPQPKNSVSYSHPTLVTLRDISVAYLDKPVLHNISWEIKPGDFWELRGANGSGKTTLLSLITGDNPKAFGQELFLFGYHKGSGESVWDIKKHIGYITPALTDRFRGYHSLENMLISGLVDSIGLYTRPSEEQITHANSWLALIGMSDLKDTYFHELSKGQQRLVMCARAMIKQPLLLILDEPTSDLDDKAADLVIHLVNKLGNESNTAIVFVSHRKEPGLKADSILELIPSEKGSTGKILT